MTQPSRSLQYASLARGPGGDRPAVLAARRFARGTPLEPSVHTIVHDITHDQLTQLLFILVFMIMFIIVCTN